VKHLKLLLQEIERHMSKKAFDKIAAGLNDAIEIAQGRAAKGSYRIHVPSNVDVKGIRSRLGLTQAEFAAQFGFSLGALRDWEQGRNTPEQSNRAFLTVIDKETEAVMRALEPA
jgi:putative transcriptional regulator